MHITSKKENYLNRIEKALRENLKKRKQFKNKQKKNIKKMSVLSDKWIKKMAMEKEMIKPFVEKQKKRGMYFHMACPPLVMMQEYQMNLRFLLMLIQKQ